jgi:hypothetical protein
MRKTGCLNGRSPATFGTFRLTGRVLSFTATFPPLIHPEWGLFSKFVVSSVTLGGRVISAVVAGAG